MPSKRRKSKRALSKVYSLTLSFRGALRSLHTFVLLAAKEGDKLEANLQAAFALLLYSHLVHLEWEPSLLQIRRVVIEALPYSER